MPPHHTILQRWCFFTSICVPSHQTTMTRVRDMSLAFFFISIRIPPHHTTITTTTRVRDMSLAFFYISICVPPQHTTIAMTRAWDVSRALFFLSICVPLITLSYDDGKGQRHVSGSFYLFFTSIRMPSHQTTMTRARDTSLALSYYLFACNLTKWRRKGPEMFNSHHKIGSAPNKDNGGLETHLTRLVLR
jgi:hypothetical protein